MKFNKTFDRALWVFHLNTGSCNGCDIEIVAALTPRYDVERFGLKLVGSPRHADVLLMTGPVTRAMAPRVERIYNQTPDPKVVMVIGNCGCSTGVYYETYNVLGPIDRFLKRIDPDVKIIYVPGCPPRPEALIDATAKAWLVLEGLRGDA